MTVAHPASAAAPWAGGEEAASKRRGREIQIWELKPDEYVAQTTNQMLYPAHAQQRPRTSARPAASASPARPFEGSTTYTDTFRAWPVQPRVARKGHQPALGAGAGDDRKAVWETTYGSDFIKPPPGLRSAPIKPPQHAMSMPRCQTPQLSTYAHAYVQHPPQQRASAAPKQPQLERCQFEGSSTYHDHFPAHSPMAHARRARAPQRTAAAGGAFEAETTHRASFKEIALPAALDHQLGVQVVGGNFYSMIKAGARVPALGRATFTTVVDGQTQVEIVIIAKSRSGSLELGNFIIGGVAKARVGVPRILCTFQLLESKSGPKQKVLRVKAHDEANPRSSSVWLGETP